MPEDQETHQAIVVQEGAALAEVRAGGSSHADPAGAYLVSLSTPKSRGTAIESMRRIARALGAGEKDKDCWRHVPWTKLTHAETNMIRRVLVDRYKPGVATPRLCISVLRGVLHYAFRLRLIGAEQYQRAIDLDSIRGSNQKKGRALEGEEVQQLRTHCAGLPMPYGKMVQALLSLGLGGGLRRAELAGLCVAGVGEDSVRFLGKGSKEADQPLATWAMDDLRAWLDARALLPLTVPTVFVHFRQGVVRDASLSPHAVWRIIRLEGDVACSERFAPHDLRRTYAGPLIGQDVGHAKTLMRHSDVSTTVGYDRRDIDDAKKLLTGLDSMGPRK